MIRTASVNRDTNETKITGSVNIDGIGTAIVDTGIGFFDHMLEQLAKHGGMDITLTAKGDLHIDAHHTVEDCGYVIGQAIRDALSDKRGIKRYGSAYIPMDEALSRSVVDFCGRPYLVFNVHFPRDTVGGVDVEVFREFFLAFTASAGANLHIENLYGLNTHHIIESCFKAVAKSIKEAVSIDARLADVLPSTKGTL